MKVSIGVRLFAMVSLSMLTVAAVGVGLVRWRFSAAAPAAASQPEQAAVQVLLRRLAATYRVRGDWSVVPANAEARRTWLRQPWDGEELAGGPPGGYGSTLGYRIGLLDAKRHYLAGVLASPLLVALASIDRVQRDVVVDGRTVGYLVLAKPGKPDDGLAVAFLIQQQANLAMLAAIGAVLSALSAMLLAVGFRRPVRVLVDAARRMEEARFDTRVTLARRDELGELGQAFNQLAARLDDAERSRRQWVADTSHELRTPLSVLRAQLEALHDGVRPATSANLGLLMRQVHALGQLVDDLYALACADSAQLPYAMDALAAWDVVEDTWQSFAEKFRAQGLETSITRPADRPVVRADAQRLRQVFANLLENSIRYTARGGRVDLAGDTDGQHLRLQLDDSAPGVPEPLLDRLGERFFRVEPSRSRAFGGAGLGLAMSRQIVEAHGGRLIFGASPLGGLRVSVLLPLETR